MLLPDRDEGDSIQTHLIIDSDHLFYEILAANDKELVEELINKVVEIIRKGKLNVFSTLTLIGLIKALDYKLSKELLDRLRAVDKERYKLLVKLRLFKN